MPHSIAWRVAILLKTNKELFMETEMPESIDRAKFVKKERQSRAWTQVQLAEIADVNPRTIQRLERDGAASFDTLMGVADAFGIDVRELNEFPKKKKGDKPQKKVHHLKHIHSGKALYDVIKNMDQIQFEHDESNDPRAIGAMKDIMKLMKVDIVRLYDANPSKRFDIELELTKVLQEMYQWGFYLFGIKRIVPKINGKQRTEIVLTTLYMSHSKSPKIIRDKNSTMLIPALLSEVAY